MPKPFCVDGCPVRVNIPRFIAHLRDGDMAGAAESLLGDNALPCVTGRVCPQETQCEGVCVRARKGNPVAIGYLERYVADWAMDNPGAVPHLRQPLTGRRIGIVGSGPAGLTAAGELAKKGHDVTVFEAFHAPGGVQSTASPSSACPRTSTSPSGTARVRGREVDTTRSSADYTEPELREQYDALSSRRRRLPVFMTVPGRTTMSSTPPTST